MSDQPTEGRPRRVLVTGSRTWRDQDAVNVALEVALRETTTGMVVVHGSCREGADAHARAWAEQARITRPDVTEERHPAEWSRGCGAGYARNAVMVAAAADVCLALIRGGSRGATHCAGLAEKAGIPVRRWTA